MARRAPALLLFSLLLLAGRASPPVGAQTLLPSPEPGEQLLWAAPPGWKPSDRSGRGGEGTVELVPEGQSAATWTRLLTVEIRRDQTSLAEYASAEIKAAKTFCPEAQIFPPDPITVSGLPATRFFARAQRCASLSEPESTFYVAIRGKEALYALQFGWRPYPPTEDELGSALAYVGGLRVCDPRAGGCEQARREAETGALTYPADQAAVWQKTMDAARAALTARNYARAEALYTQALQEAYRVDPVNPLLAKTYDALAEMWRARFRPSVAKQMQDAAAAIRAKQPQPQPLAPAKQ